MSALTFRNVSDSVVSSADAYERAQMDFRNLSRDPKASMEAINRAEAKVREKAFMFETAKELKNLFYRLMERLAQGLGQVAR